MTMEYLASPAPMVEPASAERASSVEPATADRLAMVEAATAEPATPVEPAWVLPSRCTNSKLETPRTEGPLPVRVLRRDGNAIFESYAAILPGAPEKNILKRTLPYWFDERDFAAYGDFKKFCVISNQESDTESSTICYVYVDENHPSPLYAIPLSSSELVPVVEDRERPDKYSITISPLPNTNKSPVTMVTILLKSRKTNRLVHQFTFDTTKDPTLAQRFYDCVDLTKKNKTKIAANNKGRTVTGIGQPQKV